MVPPRAGGRVDDRCDHLSASNSSIGWSGHVNRGAQWRTAAQVDPVTDGGALAEKSVALIPLIQAEVVLGGTAYSPAPRGWRTWGVEAWALEESGVVDADGDLDAVGRLELGEEVADVSLDGRDREVHAGRDVCVAQTGTDGDGHLPLPLGQP